MNLYQKNNKSIITVIGASLFALICIYMFIWGTLIPYFQMHRFVNTLGELSKSNISPFLFTHSIFEPETNAQYLIRYDALNFPVGNINKQNYDTFAPVLDLAIKEMEDYLAIHPYFSNYQLKLGRGYQQKWLFTHDATWLTKEEAVYKKALSYNPNRQEILYLYSINLAEQGKIKEAQAILDGVAETSPELPDTHYFRGVVLSDYLNDKPKGLREMEKALDGGYGSNTTKAIYYNLLPYFTEHKDSVSVILILKRLEKIDPEEAAAYDEVIKSIEETGVLPNLEVH